MKQRSDGAYVSVERPTLGVLIAALFACVFGAWIWSRYLTNGIDTWTILLVLAFAGDIVLGASLPTIRFVFDPSKRLVSWSSGSLLRRRGGQFPFDAVRDVVLQTAVSDKGYASYRLAICTDRDVLPLSPGYGIPEQIAERQVTELRAVLGMSPDAIHADSMAARFRGRPASS